MKEENKLRIQVKSKTEQRMMEDLHAEMITEWDIKKISVAALFFLLMMMMIGLAYYLLTSDEKDASPHKIVKKPQVAIKNNEQVKVINQVKEKKSPIKPVEIVKVKTQSHLNSPVELKAVSKAEKKPLEIKSANIKRAVLAQQTINKEPSGEIKLPFVLNKEEARSITYFTELVNMKGRSVYHEWIMNNKLIYKRNINILGNRWRVSTSKLFTYSSSGEWKVRVVNERGDILHELSFAVRK